MAGSNVTHERRVNQFSGGRAQVSDRCVSGATCEGKNASPGVEGELIGFWRSEAKVSVAGWRSIGCEHDISPYFCTDSGSGSDQEKV